MNRSHQCSWESMGCASSMTSVKLNRQHPDIQINVIEPSTAIHQDNPSSSTSQVQTLTFKTGNLLQIADGKKLGCCHSIPGSFGQGIKTERRALFSSSAKSTRSRCLCPDSSIERGAGSKSMEDACSFTSEDFQMSWGWFLCLWCVFYFAVLSSANLAQGY